MLCSANAKHQHLTTLDTRHQEQYESLKHSPLPVPACADDVCLDLLV